MPTDHPTIDLRGYQRLRALERRVSYSPVGIALGWIGCVGLGLLGYGQYTTLQTADDGFAILLTGFFMLVAAVCGLTGYLTWRLPRLKCPRCAGAMPKFVMDWPDDCRRRWLPGYEIDGRYYCEPFGDDNDQRPWVRLMKVVRCCEACQTYLDFGELHQQTCLEDDLERIRRRLPNHERDMRRRETWGKVLGYLWIGALLLGFLLMFWWSSRN
jgi:hypothetical protein